MYMWYIEELHEQFRQRNRATRRANTKIPSNLFLCECGNPITMISNLFHVGLYQPLYNGLIFLVNYTPWADAGVAIVVFTLLVKLVLFPLSKKAVVTQIKMKKLEPELNALKEKYKDDTQEQGRHILAFYKKNSINPFSSFFLVLIQFPILLALYRVFLRSGLPSVDMTLLYSFMHAPGHISMTFLGLIDIASKNIFLALLAGITTYFQISLSVPSLPPKPSHEEASFKDDFARSMNMQMKYFFPIITFFIAYNFFGAIALYLITSNLFTIGQELYVRKYLR